jgi:hypothetical protein
MSLIRPMTNGIAMKIECVTGRESSQVEWSTRSRPRTTGHVSNVTDETTPEREKKMMVEGEITSPSPPAHHRAEPHVVSVSPVSRWAAELFIQTEDCL